MARSLPLSLGATPVARRTRCKGCVEKQRSRDGLAGAESAV